VPLPQEADASGPVKIKFCYRTIPMVVKRKMATLLLTPRRHAASLDQLGGGHEQCARDF
jgi:hypothetical protein